MNAPPRRWLAVLLALICNGLGHLYAGRVAAAIATHLLWLALIVACVCTLRIGPAAAAAGAVAAGAFWIAQAVHAGALARRASAGAPRTRWSRPAGLVAFYAATVVLAMGVKPVRAAVAHTVYVPAGSMIPTVQVGDVLVVASGKPRALRGAVVELAAPPGPRRDTLLKRVVALGGDTVALRDGALVVNGTAVQRDPVPGPCTCWTPTPDGAWQEQACLDFIEKLGDRAYHTHCTPGLACGDDAAQVVPAGRVWVLGDRRDHSADSRYFGAVPEDTILGEVRWVLLSWGPSGPRWERVGQLIR